MNTTVLLVNGLAVISLLVAFYNDRKRGIRSVKHGLLSFLRLLPTVLTIIVLIGLLLGFVPPDTLQKFVGEQSGIIGILLTAGVGSVLHIPAILAFPLAASFLEVGVSVMIVAVFITALTMVGVITLPMEIRELGWEFALLRNGAALLGALIVALLMGVIL